jgi:hypothetical protein
MELEGLKVTKKMHIGNPSSYNRDKKKPHERRGWR